MTRNTMNRQATRGMVPIAGRALFLDVLEPKLVKGATLPRYSALLQVSKDSGEFKRLWESVVEVGERVWKHEAKAKLQACKDAIRQGLPPKVSPIGVRDGDLFEPELNGGFWLIQATRKADAGRCDFWDLAGVRTKEPVRPPRGGDGVIMLINVWAQAQYERINFTLEGIRLAIEGQPIGGPPQEVLEAGKAAFEQMSLPNHIPGVQAQGAIGAGPARKATVQVPVKTAPAIDGGFDESADRGFEDEQEGSDSDFDFDADADADDDDDDDFGGQSLPAEEDDVVEMEKVEPKRRRRVTKL